MIGKKSFLIIVISLTIVILLQILIDNFYRNQNNSYSPGSVLSQSKGINKVKFFDEQLFNKALTEEDRKIKEINYHIFGGIIPHDLLPSFIFSDFFDKLAIQNPETIIIIGPNHYEKGDYKFLTSFYDWGTPFGTLLSNQEIVGDLVDNKLIGVNEEVLSSDHSVGSSLPFIKYYLPNVKVVTILISGFTKQEEANLLADKLSKVINDDVVLVSAVDFSHYLNSAQAQEKDKITHEVLKKRDYKKLFLLNNDYTDSPASIAVFLMTMQKIGKIKMDTLYNTNSGMLQNEPFIETTSYFYLTYY